MASTDTVLISDPKEHTWVVEIDGIFNNQLKIDDESPSVSIFKLPETITQTKPEAYEPQQIGLGPIHHFRQWPYKKMEQKKLAVMRDTLQSFGIMNYDSFVNDVRNFVPSVRSCYDMFLEDDDGSLARIFAIDCFFLLNLFSNYNNPLSEHITFLKNKAFETRQSLEDVIKKTFYPDGQIAEAVDNQNEWELLLEGPHRQNLIYDAKKRMVAKDILMVENQIPVMVLKFVVDCFDVSSPSSSSSVSDFSPSIFRTFCEVHSPLKLCSKSQAPSSVDHLLHYMYYSIVNNLHGNQLPDVDVHKAHKRREDRESTSQGLSFLSKLPEKEIVQAYEKTKPETAVDGDDDQPSQVPKPKTPTAGNVPNINSKIPQKEIIQAYLQTVSFLEDFSKSKILIPPASKLHCKAGFHFHSLKENEGIQDIQIIGKDIYLPTLTLNTDSEVILRNLVAYETVTANSDSFPLSEYMDLMCGLVTNKDDAAYLKSQNVIIGDMGAAKVARLFKGMSGSTSTMKTKGKSKLRLVIDEINKVYESRLRTKIYLLLKKLALWLLLVLTTIGSFVEYSWKIVAFMVSIITVFMLTWQSYCDFYGCDKNTVTMLPYASS
ncbi:hypothetical protein HanPI659440_Chr10g0396591 [Helianthus annuus]|nr:hypothetical protein HanPI659440_Chr10g0396591 [Helianthus annuus]